MKKSTKVGLATSAVYAAGTFALPVFANTVDKPEAVVVQPINLDDVNTVEQADNIYKEKLAEYSTDKLLTFPELENLYNIQRLKKYFLEEKRSKLDGEYSRKTDAEILRINAKIGKLVQELNAQEAKRIKPLVETREKLEEKILAYYPTLINKDKGNLVYSSETKLTPKLVKPFKTIISEADKILQEFYQDNRLELLLEKNEYDLNDVFVVYDLISKERKNAVVYNQTEELKKKIDSLAEKREKLTNSQQKGQSNILELDHKIRKSLVIVESYQDYLNAKKEAEEFEARHGNFNKHFSVSILKQILLQTHEGLDIETGEYLPLTTAEKQFENAQETIAPVLESFIQSEGFSVELEGFNNPAKRKLPVFLGTFVLGFGLPVIRNIFVKGYLKGSTADEDEYIGTIAAGIGNGLMGALFLDGLHPLVFPARMLSPLFFQPLFRILKIDPCEGINF